MSNKEIMRVVTEITWGMDIKAISTHYDSKEEFINNGLTPQIALFVRCFCDRMTFSEDEKTLRFIIDTYEHESEDVLYIDFLIDLTNRFNYLHQFCIPHSKWLGDATKAPLDAELKKLTETALTTAHEEKELARRARINARKQEKKT